MSETFELRIDSIAAGGDGVGRTNGLVVFVPRTAPGDVARVTATRHDRLMRGRVIELLEASPLRADPPCTHYAADRCGGCQLQHLRYDASLSAKSAIVSDALARIGRVDVQPPVVEPSEKTFRYRRKLTLALRHRDGGWIAGLHRFDAPGEVFAIEDCPITDERVVRVWAAVMSNAHFLPAAAELRGAVRTLPAAFSFTLEGGHHWPAHGALFEAVPDLGELWWQPEGASRRLLSSRASGDPAGAAQAGAAQAGASFVQVNPAVAATLQAWVLSLAAAMQPKTVVDAYAGTGDLAVELAARGARVIAIDADRDAARVAGARLPDGSRAIAAPVERALRKALPAELVILNPPRAGVDLHVAELLNAQAPKPRAVVYVSCNPATLARDIRRLSGYLVRSVRAFDMFPQTAHVETVCELVPAA